jgi:hypothetical protein
MTRQNLWPTDIVPETEPTPADVLMRQAEELEKATNGRLIGRVEVGSQEEKISLNFVIVAPALDNFQYRLFKVLHGVYPPYPAQIVVDMTDGRDAANQEEFEAQLSRVLQSAATRKVLGELLTLTEKANAGVVKRKKKKKKK